MINNFLGGLFGKIVENAEGILDEVITTKEEKEAIKLELRRILLEAEREAFNKEVEDRKDARSLYKKSWPLFLQWDTFSSRILCLNTSFFTT